MPPARSRSFLAALTALALVGGVFLAGSTAATTAPARAVAASAAAARPLPSHDAFYRYAGHTPLSKIKPGSVLKKRSVTIHLSSAALPLTGEQLLYRTTDELRRPSVTVTTVIAPTPVAKTLGIEAYLSFYDALGPECDPSFTLAGGNPGTADGEQEAELEEGLISLDLAQGVAVTVPDFEGEHLDWGAGQEAGYSTLDSVRATESYLGAPASTKVGLSGYSGGSIAAEWGAELQPTYAPAVHLIGTVAGGIPVDLAHNLKYVNGSVSWSGVIPATTVSLARAFDVSFQNDLSPYGRKIAHQVRNECIGSFLGSYPHLRIQRLLKPKYHNVFSIAPFRHIVNHMIMGRAPGHPLAPMFFGVGNADGTGDGVMVTRDVEALAHEYCRQGVSMQLNIYKGADHDTTAIEWEPVASAWLLARFQGVPATSNCSAIGAGNKLTPVPAPK